MGITDVGTNDSQKTFVTMVSPDWMKAYVVLLENKSREVSADEICNELRIKGVKNGINHDAINDLLKNPIYEREICIAEGQPPINGLNGSIDFKFNTNKSFVPLVFEDGKANFRELNLIENVKEGQTLCTIVPAKQGVDGFNLKGDRIKAVHGKNPILPRGKNVRTSEDGTSLVSLIDGQVDYNEGSLVNVFATYEVKDDVDNSIGNISFVGNVVIRGNVLSGFSIEAGGNVEVWGVVEAASITAKGNITLRKGIYGNGVGKLTSDGDIFARFIENSIITAKRDIKAEAVMHSHIKCGGVLEVSGRKGLIVGGTTKVAKEIRAKVVGSILSTATEIETGLDPSVRERFKEVKDEMSSIESDLKKAEQAITILKKMEQMGNITDEKKELLLKSTRTKIFLSSRFRELEAEKAEIDLKLQEKLPGKIKVSDYIYPGTRVAIGSCLMFVKDTLQNCTLYRDGADVRVGPGERW